jgi:hypothetical protein
MPASQQKASALHSAKEMMHHRTGEVRLCAVDVQCSLTKAKDRSVLMPSGRQSLLLGMHHGLVCGGAHGKPPLSAIDLLQHVPCVHSGVVLMCRCT